MGRRGPAPKPTALRILQGNPGKVTLNTAEPQPAMAPEDFRPPAWLVNEAKEVWTRLRPDLPWLSRVDVDVFAAYCATYARWREAEDVLETEGMTFVIRARPRKGQKLGAIKYVQQRPEVAIARNSLTMLVKLGGELGLSPAARTRIHVEPDKPEQKDQSALRLLG